MKTATVWTQESPASAKSRLWGSCCYRNSQNIHCNASQNRIFTTIVVPSTQNIKIFNCRHHFFISIKFKLQYNIPNPLAYVSSRITNKQIIVSHCIIMFMCSNWCRCSRWSLRINDSFNQCFLCRTPQTTQK